MSAQLLAIILGMALVTFGIRFTLFALGKRATFPPRVRRALAYVPVAVLTAITVPMVLLPDAHWDLSWRNPWLAGALASLAFALRARRLLGAIAAGMAVFLLWRWAFGA
ncbi:AzlD domain-containing protein [Thiomonas sp. FB-Cd]|uniref:AzlD domain-containing protein n=2 Tax=Pseudomonadota TaxID=1224 RepID=UPI0004DF828F|nr:AzlD domain-containing protein [Thiomonas sp. FB-Cd]